jgi:hypothetical protein
MVSLGRLSPWTGMTKKALTYEMSTDYDLGQKIAAWVKINPLKQS